MKFNIETVSEKSKLIKVEIPHERVQKEFEKLYSELAQNAVIPGFRKGKIPRGMLKLRLGEDIANQIGFDLIRETLPDILKSIEDVIVGTPEVAEWKIDENQAFQFEVSVEILPPMDLKEYKGIEVPKKSLEISDDEIQESLERIREGQATYEVVRDRPAELNDRIYGRITLKGDDEPVPGWTNRHLEVNIGEDTFFPGSGMEEKMIGAEIEKEHTFTMDFASDYSYYKDLAGKSVTATLALTEIKIKTLPDINDDLARDMGLETKDELMEMVRKNIEQERNQRIDHEFESAIIEKIVKANSVEVPEALVDQESEFFVDSYFSQGAMDEKTREMFINQMKPAAKLRVQERLILSRIAELEQIETTEEELENTFKEMAEQQKKTLEAIRSEWEEEKAVDNLKRELARKKAMDWLKENVTIGDWIEPSETADPQESQNEESDT